MNTSKLNTFNAEEIIDKLRLYVSEVKEMNRLGYEHTYTGFQYVKNITLLLTFKPNMLSMLLYLLPILLVALYYNISKDSLYMPLNIQRDNQHIFLFSVSQFTP